MKCVRCLAELPNQSQFCLRCGAPTQAPPPPTTSLPHPTAPPPTANPVFAAKPNNKPMIATVAVLSLLVLGLGAFVVKGQLAQKAGANGNGNMVQAPGQSGGGALVQAPGQSGGGALVQAPAASDPNKLVQAPPGDSTPFPADIDDYLKFVHQIDATKENIARDQNKVLLTMIATAPVSQLKDVMAGTDNPTPEGDPGRKETEFGSEAAGKMADIASQFNTLSELFQKRQPPQSCVDLRNKYAAQLGLIQTRILQVQELLVKMKRDPSAALQDAYGMQNTSGDLDKAAASADAALADICNRYKLHKDFDIKGDDSSAGLTR